MKNERIAKRIAGAGVCSRRQAEKLIEEGRVQVNGDVIESPALNVQLSDKVIVDGMLLPSSKGEIRLFRLYKPTGVLCTNYDPQGRPTVFDMLPHNIPRLILVGRLDMNSEGLLLLTNNGKLAQQLMKSDFPRTYRVRVHGEITEKGLEKLRKGITVEGIRYKPIKISEDKSDKGGKNRWFTMIITEGKNREVRRVFEAIGGRVNRLLRLSYGDFELGNLNLRKLEEVDFSVVKSLCKELEV